MHMYNIYHSCWLAVGVRANWVGVEATRRECNEEMALLGGRWVSVNNK